MGRWSGEERHAFKDHDEAVANGAKDRAALEAVQTFTPLDRARFKLGQVGIRFEGAKSVADVSALEDFIREVVRDEMNRPIPVVDGYPQRRR